MDMAISVSLSGIVGLGGCWKFTSLRRSINPAPNTPLVPIRFTTTTKGRSSVVPRALDPKASSSSSSAQKEDLVYVVKLTVGSFVGAGAIKYGSALFPEITTPNLVLALSFIFTPVLVAALLLFKEGLRQKQ